MPLLQKPVLRQMFRFAAVGAVGTLVQYLVLGIGVELLSLSAAISSGAGYILGSIVNYLLNYKFTFESDKSHRDTAFKYYAILAVGWSINTGLMWFLADHYGLNYWFAQIIATGTSFLWNFSGSRLWAFKPARG
ncbi:MAG: GtrA family protein [Gammaproteobacteria bacterium]